MLTAMIAVRNILGDNHDLWQVNTDMDYHEEQNLSADSKEYSLTKLSSTQPMVPSQLSPNAYSSYIDKAIIRLFSRIDKFSFASSVGICSALCMFLGTIWLVLNGVKPYDKNFILLSNYFIGYEVSLKGAMIGSGYGLFWGFILGWSFAYLRNLTLGIIVYIEKKKLESRSFRNLLDYI